MLRTASRLLRGTRLLLVLSLLADPSAAHLLQNALTAPRPAAGRVVFNESALQTAIVFGTLAPLLHGAITGRPSIPHDSLDSSGLSIAAMFAPGLIDFFLAIIRLSKEVPMVSGITDAAAGSLWALGRTEYASQLTLRDRLNLKIFMMKAGLAPTLLGKIRNRRYALWDIVRRVHPYTLHALQKRNAFALHYLKHDGMYYALWAEKIRGSLPPGGIPVINFDSHPDHVDYRPGVLSRPVGVTDADWASAAVRDDLAPYVLQISLHYRPRVTLIMKGEDGEINVLKRDIFDPRTLKGLLEFVGNGVAPWCTVDADFFSVADWTTTDLHGLDVVIGGHILKEALPAAIQSQILEPLRALDLKPTKLITAVSPEYLGPDAQSDASYWQHLFRELESAFAPYNPTERTPPPARFAGMWPMLMPLYDRLAEQVHPWVGYVLAPVLMEGAFVLLFVLPPMVLLNMPFSFSGWIVASLSLGLNFWVLFDSVKSLTYFGHASRLDWEQAEKEYTAPHTFVASVRIALATLVIWAIEVLFFSTTHQSLGLAQLLVPLLGVHMAANWRDHLRSPYVPRASRTRSEEDRWWDRALNEDISEPLPSGVDPRPAVMDLQAMRSWLRSMPKEAVDLEKLSSRVASLEKTLGELKHRSLEARRTVPTERNDFENWLENLAQHPSSLEVRGLIDDARNQLAGIHRVGNWLKRFRNLLQNLDAWGFANRADLASPPLYAIPPDIQRVLMTWLQWDPDNPSLYTWFYEIPESLTYFVRTVRGIPPMHLRTHVWSRIRAHLAAVSAGWSTDESVLTILPEYRPMAFNLQSLMYSMEDLAAAVDPMAQLEKPIQVLTETVAANEKTLGKPSLNVLPPVAQETIRNLLRSPHPNRRLVARTILVIFTDIPESVLVLAGDIRDEPPPPSKTILPFRPNKKTPKSGGLMRNLLSAA